MKSTFEEMVEKVDSILKEYQEKGKIASYKQKDTISTKTKKKEVLFQVYVKGTLLNICLYENGKAQGRKENISDIGLNIDSGFLYGTATKNFHFATTIQISVPELDEELDIEELKEYFKAYFDFVLKIIEKEKNRREL